MKQPADVLLRFGNDEGGGGGAKKTRAPGAGRPSKGPRVPLKIYVTEALRDRLTRMAVEQHGKGGRRNDLIERALEEFACASFREEPRHD